MNDPNVAVTGGILSLARQDANDIGLEIGKLTTMFSSIAGKKHYEVWEEGKGAGGPVWSGRAYNASEAKYKYISRLIDKHWGSE